MSDGLKISEHISDKGYRTFYEQALIVSEQLGFVSRLHLRARITKGEETYAVSRKICFEDFLCRLSDSGEAVAIDCRQAFC